MDRRCGRNSVIQLARNNLNSNTGGHAFRRGALAWLYPAHPATRSVRAPGRPGFRDWSRPLGGSPSSEATAEAAECPYQWVVRYRRHPHQAEESVSATLKIPRYWPLPSRPAHVRQSNGSTDSRIRGREPKGRVQKGTYPHFYPDRARLDLEGRSCRSLAPAEPIARASH